MSGTPENTLNRRSFLNRTASMLAGTALGTTAVSYGRIVGANDRISLAHIGIGDRGRELDWLASRLKDKHNVEMTAVCDLWKVNRERRSMPTALTTAGRRVSSSISRTFCN